MEKTLENIYAIYQSLEAYGVAEHVVIDLSLINHMDYYSDMIFQGFIGKVGKPILMGGRYNTLANQFDSNLPAIGFACDIDFLIAGIESSLLPKMNPVDITVLFEKALNKEGLQLAKLLRDKKYNVLTYMDSTNESRIPTTRFTIKLTKENNILIDGDQQFPFKTNDEIIALLQQVRERI